MKAIGNSRECPFCGGNHKSRPFCEYEDGYHCFSCGANKRSERGFSVSTKQRMDIPEWPDAESNPDAFSIPALTWLAKYYITPELIRQHNIMCLGDTLIFPHIKDGALINYQTRNVINRVITTSGEKIPMLLHTQFGSDTLIIVEDFISAINVSKSHNVLCLWGTKLNFEEIKYYTSIFNKFYVWLDNDHEKAVNSGQIAALKICKMLQSSIQYINRQYAFNMATSKRVYNITTAEDPKCYTSIEINEAIKGAGDYDNI